MMWQSIRGLFTVRHHYVNPVEAERAMLLLYTGWVFIALNLGILVFTLPAVLSTGIGILDELVFLPGLLLTPLVFYLLQRGSLRNAAWLFLALILIPVAFEVINNFDGVETLLAVFPILIASFLLNWRGQVLTLMAVIGAGLYGVLLKREGQIDLGPELTVSISVYLLATTGAALVVYMFGYRLIRLIARAAQELNRFSQIATLLSSSSDEKIETPINHTLEILAHDLGYPIARVYVLDNTGSSIQTIYSRLGVEPASKETRKLPPGSGLLEVTLSREPLYLNQNDASVRRGHFQQGISEGIIYPLFSGSSVIGLLDVQSPSGLKERDRETIQVLALQLSVSLAHLSLVDALRRELKEQQEIVTRQRDRLRQFERDDRQAILNAWGNYLRERGEAILGFDLDETSLAVTPASEINESIREALASGEVVTTEQGDAQQVSVPVMLRGQVLGAVAISLPAARPLTRRQTEMIVSVVQRLALALDNKRLFEQSQAQAQRESKASEIAGLLISTTSLETVLELAADSFNDALGAIQTRIHVADSTDMITQPEEAR